jgi:hypothetical protein
MDIQDLLNRQELGTYLDGLKDALNMSKSEIRKTIKIIQDKKIKEQQTMVTKKQVKQFIPKGAMHLSMGKEFCAYNLNGNIETLYYSELFPK